MTDKELIQQLSDLKYAHAPKSLKGKVTVMVEDLPAKHKGFYFPLFAFQMAVVTVVLIVLAGLGSGVVVASKAQPGAPLFPMKEILHTIVPQIVIEKAPTPTRANPTPTITPTVSPTIPPSQKHQVRVTGNDENEGNEENFFQKTIEKIQDVKGVHTEQRRNESNNEDELQKDK